MDYTENYKKLNNAERMALANHTVTSKNIFAMANIFNPRRDSNARERQIMFPKLYSALCKMGCLRIY